MNSRWVDFRELRAKLRFADVLADYGVELRIKGERASGFCPLPGHSGRRNSPSFSANLQRGIFQCFGCGAKGNVLDFAALMEGVNPSDSAALREVALKLQEKFVAVPASVPSRPRTVNPPSDKHHGLNDDVHPKKERQEQPEEASTLPVVVNSRLDFELKGLVSDHPYLKLRGLSPETIAHFGLGYCSRGLMQGRIAIPLHDSQGQLIGYAGRLVDDNAINADNPKYRFPSAREREGKRYEFHKSLFVYNGHRIPRPVDDLIVVEGFPSVWWLHQNGYTNVVAVMGSSCSSEQAALIVDHTRQDGRIWLMPDGDDAGQRCAADLLIRLSPQRFCRWIDLDADKQPTDCDAKALNQLLPGLQPGKGGSDDQRV